MKIYTKKGDSGMTSLLGGTRLPKAHLRIEAYGTVDELNAYMGWIHELEVAEAFRPLIRQVQHNLFVVGSILATDPTRSAFKPPALSADCTAALEASIDEMEAHLPPLKNFVLPGGHQANALAHVARCVCRRAERRIVALHAEEAVPEPILPYLNRLSDWLFVLSRRFSQLTQSPEILWE
ncbi:MAG: cob(I)yrinic acid a,c-diamide adenosyltransferase [Bacteroidetes bacterium]|nr:MAG: cob(I)yrinic acid a,c-diamide adenosyltransferase [Bacteroidota bacterium]